MSFTAEQVALLACRCVGRRSDYALQRSDGRYFRVGAPLSARVLALHLAGGCTIGTYLLDEADRCRFAVFDADSDASLLELLSVQARLAADGIPAYLELSRRGGHLWVFFSGLLPAVSVRAWLLPYSPAGVEFYPKQGTCDEDRPYGSLVRVPFGVHRLSGRRYPFVAVSPAGQLSPVARTLTASLDWLAAAGLAAPPANLPRPEAPPARPPAPTPMLNKKPSPAYHVPPSARTITDWCMQQDPLTLIGHYVPLDGRGMGHCPFGEHHSDGRDSRPSFQVRPLRSGSTNCWYCYAWQRGGSVFTFLCLWYGVSAREMWRRILAGEPF